MYSGNRILKALRWLMLGNAVQRRRVMLECARISASAFGDFPLSDDYKLWRRDKAFIEKFKALSPGNRYSEDRKYTLREYVYLVRKVPGAMAECGCYEGASAWFMASALPDVPLYLFDSFAGLSPLCEQDSCTEHDHFKWKEGDMRASKEKVMATLSTFRNVTIYAGWIPDRFKEVTDQRFRLVHIDVDLYQPTWDSLDFFYPRLNPGGVIVLDDYGFTVCPGARKAVGEYMADKPEYILHLTTGQGIILKSG